MTKQRKHARIAALFTAVMLLGLPAGCWNYREISDVTFIAGAGVDIDPAGGYLLTLETVDFASGGAGTPPKPSLITTSAPTITQAVEMAERSVSSRLYWNHAAVVVMGESLAKQGTGPVVDFILHNLDTAMNIWLLVAESGTAQHIFGLKTRGSEIVSYALRDIMQDNPWFGQTIPERLFETMENLQNKEKITLLALVSQVKQNEEDTISVSGCAVMRDGRTIEALDGEQTAAVLALRGKLSEHAMAVKYDGQPAAVRLLDVSRRLTPDASGGTLRIKIDVDAGYAVTEQARAVDQQVFSNVVADTLEGKLTEIITYAQQTLGMDLFGFHEYLQSEHPLICCTNGGVWDAAFREMECVITVRAREIRGPTGPMPAP